MDGTLDPLDVSPCAKDLAARSFNPQEDYVLKLTAINEILGAHVVEHIPAGSNAKSPAIDYVNMGDTYDATILRLPGGRYRVGCWGDIVERGSYN